jgi:2-haloacid dehalogenase
MFHPLYVFDAYGTLFDVHSAVARHRGAVGEQADRLSEIWRTKQLEYTWTRSLMGAHRDFAELTAQALDFAIARCGGVSAATREALLSAYDTLDAFADVAPTLQALKGRGARLVILSNGTPEMLASAIRSAGLAELLDESLSVESAGVFKTDARVYGLVEERYGLRPGEVSFQSSNRWDVAGASKFGFRAVWINRTGAPDEYADMPPARTLAGLAGLLDY